MRWVPALIFAFVSWAAFAQADKIDFLARVSKWQATESWGKAPLVYTFEPKGTFKSSDWDGGKGHGTWTHAGKVFVMIWPDYAGVLYEGKIEGEQIQGTAYRRDGSVVGTFVFRLIK